MVESPGTDAPPADSRPLDPSPPAAPIVEIDDLTFRYRRATEPAIRNVSLTIRPGEVLLVAGPSGCGKSTLIRAMNGLIPHAYRGELSGSVRVAGRSTTELRLREISETVGTLLQDPAKQIVGATVQSELAFGPENHGVPPEEIRSRMRAVARETGIESLLGRTTADLSGGERQLVAMGGILMMEPRLFVVDEPLANLDPATATELLDLLRRLADGGHAIVIVEHRVEEALALEPDRVLAMEDGRATFMGRIDDFLAVANPAAVKLPFHAALARYRDALSTPISEAAEDEPDAPATLPASVAPATATAPRVVFRALRVELGEREVLRGIDAELGPTEVVALLGPNGSGKTTLFRAAMGLVAPSVGAVLVDGSDVRTREVAELAQTIGYVFQSPSQMLFARTVRDELLFGPRNLGFQLPDEDAHAESALRRVGLADEEAILDRPPLTLSFGQQKRLALAIALALNPRTLILDEPSAGQDHRTASAFMREVVWLPGLESVYLITHDVDLALVHADRILLLRDGRIVADGPPSEIIEDVDRWRASNLHRTSLMEANLARRGATGRFLDAEALAREILADERRANQAGDGG